MKYIDAIIKGVAIAVFLVAINMTLFSFDWWLALISLNVVVSVK